MWVCCFKPDDVANVLKMSPSIEESMTNTLRPTHQRPAPLSIQNLINKHDKNIKITNNNNTNINNYNHSNNYLKSTRSNDFNNSEDESSTNRIKQSPRKIKEERNGNIKNDLEQYNRKRSFSLDTSSELIKSNNQSDADIKVIIIITAKKYIYISKKKTNSNICFTISD